MENPKKDEINMLKHNFNGEFEIRILILLRVYFEWISWKLEKKGELFLWSVGILEDIGGVV